MPKVRCPLFVLLGISILFVCVASSVTSWLITYSYSRNALIDISHIVRQEISMEMSMSVSAMFDKPKTLLSSMQNAVDAGVIDVSQLAIPLKAGESKSKVSLNDPALYMAGMIKRMFPVSQSAYLLNNKGSFWLANLAYMQTISNCTEVMINGTCERLTSKWFEPNSTIELGKATYDASVRPWYKSTPHIPNTLSLTPVYVQYWGTILMTTTAQALFGKSGEYLATVALDAKVGELSESLKKFNVSNSTLLFILQDEPRLPFIANRNGNYTNMANKDYLMSAYESEVDAIRDFGIDLRDRHYPLVAESQAFETKTVIWEVRRITIGGLGMLLCVGLDKKELMEPINKGLRLAGILVAVVTFALVLLGAALGWFIARSLTLLCELLKKAAEMKVENYVEKDAFISEVHIIQQSIGKLMKELKEYKSFMPAALFKGDSDNDDDSVPSSKGAEVETKGSETAADEHYGELGTRTKPSKSIHAGNAHGANHVKRRRDGSSDDGSSDSAGKVYRKSKIGGQLTTKEVTVMCVSAVNFIERLQNFDSSTSSQLLNRMFDAVHSVAAPKKGHIELSSNGQIIVSWNAQTRCIDHLDTAASCALQLKSKLAELYAAISSDCGTSCKFTIAIATGQALCGVVGNDAARTITTIGVPVAACQTTANCISDLHTDVLVVCDSTANRLKYSFVLKPIDSLLYSHLKRSAHYRQATTLCEVLHHKATSNGKDAEWMYQLQDMEQAQSAYTKLFVTVSSGELDISKSLSQIGEYLATNNGDSQALRLGVILEQTKNSGGAGLVRTVVPWKLLYDNAPDTVAVSVENL